MIISCTKAVNLRLPSGTERSLHSRFSHARLRDCLFDGFFHEDCPAGTFVGCVGRVGEPQRRPLELDRRFWPRHDVPTTAVGQVSPGEIWCAFFFFFSLPRFRVPRAPHGFDASGLLTVRLPRSVSPAKLRVRVGRGRVVVSARSGSRRHERKEGPGFVSESYSSSGGAFSESFSVPRSTHADDVEATVTQDGILHLQLLESAQTDALPSTRMERVAIRQSK